jgi:hypothetical protein
MVLAAQGLSVPALAQSSETPKAAELAATDAETVFEPTRRTVRATT